VDELSADKLVGGQVGIVQVVGGRLVGGRLVGGQVAVVPLICSRIETDLRNRVTP
jgi:hypothetical protein